MGRTRRKAQGPRSREPRPRRRTACTHPHGVRRLFAAHDLAQDKLHGRIKRTRTRTNLLEFCRYLRTRHPAHVRIAIVVDNHSPHLATKQCRHVADRAEADTVEIGLFCSICGSVWSA